MISELFVARALHLARRQPVQMFSLRWLEGSRSLLSGELKVRKEPPSVVPERGKPVPVSLRLISLDRIPSVGIRDVFVKYRFWNDTNAYTTEARPVCL